MRNKKIFLISLIFGSFFLWFSFGGLKKVEAADQCCLNGSTCANIPSDITEDYCKSSGWSVIDCSSNSNCKTTTSAATSSGTTTTFPNPLGITTVSEFLNKFLTSLRGIVAVTAIIFIVLGGIMYMLSAGNEKMITRAKLCWTGAVIGLAIVLAAPSFLTEIINIFGGTNGITTAGLTGPTFYQIGVNILNLLLSILGIIAIISLVIGGGMYLTSYGDEKRIETGKKIIVYSIIGIVVALSAVVIVNEISSLISGY